ncbi:hypothetical protein BY996DRAFT_8315579 [Phakopsora pachyrhizi]|uniref:Translocation protein sec72 n=1 Tax=Phakopsora pachyrhizi TaxID=170000 RepID=A0AAV0BFU7_PHAPC|nr:hypothetical protein BY996DRAFT_8315579 [Phakopsora pachyrhizi]CAH7675316.1 hypothetical protein PPACK8108_LOCUS10308 [Phakopsora pachyrhizi]CAH7685814.1 hypothetical protein PPACK8108_LOCUS20397 [Phakopsora pachyrhizi]
MASGFSPHNPTAHLKTHDDNCCHHGPPKISLSDPTSLEDQILIYNLSVDQNNLKVTTPSIKSSKVDSSDNITKNKGLEEVLTIINDLSQYLARAPSPHCPPQPQMHPENPRSLQLAQIKEEGNSAFKSNNFKRAIELYTTAAELASTRPLFEPSILMREEMSVILCNRAAAYSSMKMWTEALCDSDAVIKLKRNWSKGHFRKCKALQGLNLLIEAENAALLGLEFEPDNADLQAALKEIINLKKSS